jgi:hypothetical protein
MNVMFQKNGKAPWGERRGLAEKGERRTGSNRFA